MNKKFIINKDGERFFFIVDGEKPLTDELEKVFSIEKGFGLTAEQANDRIIVKNYYRAENLASFPILEVLDTAEEAKYILTKVE